jgi:hypothetical protein
MILIAEALWLLADPEGYKGKLKNKVQKAVEKTVRQLKTEEARKITSSSVKMNESKKNPSKTNKEHSQDQTNLFKRF